MGDRASASLRRAITRLAVPLLLGGFAICFLLGGWGWALGYGVGAGVGLVNLCLLVRAVGRVRTTPQAVSIVAVVRGSLLRLMLAALILFTAIALLQVNVVALIVGLLVVQVATATVGYREGLDVDEGDADGT